MSEQGLSAVYMAQRPVLLRLLTARLGNADEAEEVVQELWLRLQRSKPGPIADPAAYLFRMASNLATDRRLSHARREKRDDAWKGMEPGDADYPDSERQLAARQELAQVEAVLAEMPERMRRALLMFRVEEQPQRVIADTLGITVSGVEKLLRRGYRHLVERMAGDGADSAAPYRLGNEGSSQ